MRGKKAGNNAQAPPVILGSVHVDVRASAYPLLRESLIDRLPAMAKHTALGKRPCNDDALGKAGPWPLELRSVHLGKPAIISPPY
jgi:hypothetical protein